MSDKYQNLFSDTIILGIGHFSTKFIMFFLMPLYTLYMTPKEYGLADLLTNLLYLILPILSISIFESVFRFLLDKDCNSLSVFNNGIRIVVYGGFLILIVVLILYLFIPYTYILLFGLLYILESIKQIIAQYVRGIGLIKVFACNGIIASIVLLFSTFFLLGYLKLGVNGYLIAFIISNIIAIIYMTLYCGIIRIIVVGRYDKYLMVQMVKYSLPLIPNMLSWWFTTISSRYIIVWECGLATAGLYAAASKIPTLINVATTVFQQSWQFAAVKEYQDTNNKMFYSRVFESFSLFLTTVGSFILTIIPYISKFVLIGNFYFAWSYTPLLIYSAILGGYSIYLGTFYSVVKNNKGAMFSTMTGAIVNLFLCFLLIPLFQVWGALISSVCSYTVIVIFRFINTKNLIDIDIKWRNTILYNIVLLFQSILLSIGTENCILLSHLIFLLLIIINRHSIIFIISHIVNQKRNEKK